MNNINTEQLIVAELEKVRTCKTCGKSFKLTDPGYDLELARKTAYGVVTGSHKFDSEANYFQLLHCSPCAQKVVMDGIRKGIEEDAARPFRSMLTSALFFIAAFGALCLVLALIGLLVAALVSRFHPVSYRAWALGGALLGVLVAAVFLCKNVLFVLRRHAKRKGEK